MVHATSGVRSTDPLSLNLSNTNKNPSVDSFAQQLAQAIEGYLGNVHNGSHFEIDVQSGQDQSFTVNVKNLTAAPTANARPSVVASPATTPAAAPATPATVAPAPTALAAPAQSVDKSNMTPTDAYWAEQPAAVQALRTMPDDERFAAAQDLAKQGYTIDVPIMVWGWDPLVTMTLRQNEGYTWVPSAMQANIPIGPGVTNVWNLPSYDPKNPPPGSIKVSTDFAQGSNMQDPWIKTLSAT